MRNAQGEFIWYELLTTDMAKARAFYEAVVGWKSNAAPVPDGTGEYLMLMRPDGGDKDATGGAMQLTAEMTANGARPMWAGYIGVDDVDATVAQIEAAGGQVLMPAFDLPNVGRMAFVTDPQGNPFYVMRGSPDERSEVYSETSGDIAKCGWNELMVADLDAALAFHGSVFGMTVNERMAMGEGMGDYCFLDVGTMRIGAAMRASEGAPTGWQFYFRVPDIEEAKTAVEKNGGTVFMGPHEVPGEEMILVAVDPCGANFGLVAPRKG